ncbi:MAG: hypothetical protein HYS09_09145 [Chloroflexi bacterium]|nr:hypothetical protein [Chloroflexota bacterium]
MGGALALALLALLAFQSNAPSAGATHLCGDTGSSAGPFKLLTYEAKKWRRAYNRALNLAGHNRLFPDVAAFKPPKLETGPRSDGSSNLTGPYVPPTLLKAIAWIESTWIQADWSVPYGEVGPVLVSHDCGYGMMQITTGMQNTSGVPSLQQAMIGGHYAFNIARGVQILIDKWNAAPEWRPIVGKRNPSLVETWYYAVWGYNGFAWKNHPLNPAYDWPRPTYKGCDNANDGIADDRSRYPYQELVFGCMRNPPVFDGTPLWNPIKVHLPDLSDPAFRGPLSPSNWSACAVYGDCAAMDIPTPNPSNTDSAGTSLTRAEVLGEPSIKPSPEGLTLSALHGDTSLPVSLTIANGGSGVLAWRASVSEPWLRISRVQGVSLGDDLGPKKLTISVRGVATAIPAGEHTATIIIDTLYPPGSVKVNATFRVFELPDGSIIRDSSATYLIKRGFKRLVPDRATFQARKFDQAEVTKVPDSLTPTIPDALPLLSVLDDGNIIKGRDSTTHYVMEGGQRRPIPSATVFGECGYGWDAVYRITEETLSHIPKGVLLTGPPCPEFSPPSGALLRGSESPIYVMRGKLKRYIPNSVTFSVHGYLTANLNRVPDSSLAAIPTGDRLLSALAEGNLLKGRSGSTRYVMRGGRRHSLTNSVMEDCGYGTDAILTVPDGKLSSVPEGAPLSGPPCPQLVPPSGALLMGSDTVIYLMRRNLKRQVPNPLTFSAEGFRTANVNQLADSTLAAISTGEPILNAKDDGNLLTGSGDAIYVMEGGAKRHVTSPSVMTECGYGSDAVRQISDTRLAALPEGANLSGPPCPKFVPPSGSLLRSVKGSKVFVMSGGLRRYIPDPVTFHDADYHWGNLNVLASSYMKAIPIGHPLLSVLADGNLLKANGTGVYVMEGGVRRLVYGTKVMNACGYSWDAVHRISKTVLKSIPLGEKLKAPPCPQLIPPDGFLLQGTDDPIYVMDGGLKRRVASPSVFEACGYRAGNINAIADSTLAAIPTGDDVTAAPCPQPA